MVSKIYKLKKCIAMTEIQSTLPPHAYMYSISFQGQIKITFSFFCSDK